MTMHSNPGKAATYASSQLLQRFSGSYLTDPVRRVAGSYHFVNASDDIEFADFDVSKKLTEGGHMGWPDPIEWNPYRPPANILLLFPQSDDQSDIDKRLTASNIINSRLVDTQNGYTYRDDYYKKSLPLDRDDQEISNKIGKTDVINVVSSYNSNTSAGKTSAGQIYEDATANDGISENVLPNFYTLYAEHVWGDPRLTYGAGTVTDGPELLSRINGLGGSFSSDLREGFTLAIAGALPAENEISQFEQYFKDFAIALRNISPALVNHNSGLSVDYNTFIFGKDALPLLSQEPAGGKMFPMHNNISFSTDRNATFADKLIELGAEKELLKYVSWRKENPVSLLPSRTTGISTEQYTPTEFGTSVVSKNFSLISEKRTIIQRPASAGGLPNTDGTNLLRWATLDENTLFAGIGSDKVFIGDSDFDAALKLHQPGHFNTNHNSKGAPIRAFLEEMESEEANGRTPQQVFEGDEAYSEAIFYTIEKFTYPSPSATESNASPITTYYIPNSSQMDICNFIDTQVKYGKRYKYVVTSYDLVVSSIIKYSDGGAHPAGTHGSGPPNTIYSNRNVMPIIIDMYENQAVLRKSVIATLDNVVVMDYPPLPPEVKIVPYKDMGDKILINLNSSVGDVDLFPVMIHKEE